MNTLKIIILVIVLIYALVRRKNSQVYPGTVIILNGPSGSGKTSIQKEFQYLMMPNLWIKLGIDTLFDAPMPTIIPENMSFWQSSNSIRWIERTYDHEGNNVITLFVGEQGEKVAYGMNSAIAAYAKNGCNVIVDYIAYKQEWIDDLRKQLKDIKTFYVAVEIPLEVLEQREASRGTSPKGHARSHYDSVYGNVRYDLVVNTATETSQEIALRIKHLVEPR